MMNRAYVFAVTIGLVVLGSAFAFANEPTADATATGTELAQTTQPTADAPAVTRAIAVLHAIGDSGVTGTITFTQVEDGIRVVANVTGLSAGARGFHVHEYGDCSAPDGTSAGGHFNPEQMSHGGPESEQRHVGDLGNITANEDGVGTYDWTDTVISFEGPHAIIGRGIIVHAGEDDLTTQPTGGAGARVACGVIGIAAAAE